MQVCIGKLVIEKKYKPKTTIDSNINKAAITDIKIKSINLLK